MLVDFLDPCPTCDGSGILTRSQAFALDISDFMCRTCDGLGLVASEADIEAVAEALFNVRVGANAVMPFGAFPSDEQYRVWARAAVTTLIEQWRNRD